MRLNLSLQIKGVSQEPINSPSRLKLEQFLKSFSYIYLVIFNRYFRLDNILKLREKIIDSDKTSQLESA